MLRWCQFALFLLMGCATAMAAEGAKYKVLLLDGQNNHDWKSTTPVLKKILESAKIFDVTVATTPPVGADAKAWEQFKPDWKSYDLVVSNFTNFGMAPCPTEWAQSLVEHVRDGGALVLVHASTCGIGGYAQWTKVAGMAWAGAGDGDALYVDEAGKVARIAKGQGPGTGHGAPHAFTVTMRATDHPIAKGLPGEFAQDNDELWFCARGPAENVEILATAKAKETGHDEPVLWTVQYGKGRVFVTLLGHSAQAMQGVGFGATFSRGCEWAITGEVTLPAPGTQSPTTAPAGTPSLDGKLFANSNSRWTLSPEGDVGGRPYLALRSPSGQELTWLHPADHPWHLGLWFSWKLINGVNYWESEADGKPKGQTLVRSTKLKDGTLAQELTYQPRGQEKAVLTEQRKLVFADSRADGSYTIDWEQVFTAGPERVTLDRTPPPSQGGPAWGGYGGLSYRCAQELTRRVLLDSTGWKSGEKLFGQQSAAAWSDLSGQSPDGSSAGVTIFNHPKNPQHPTPWYRINDGDFGFFTPALLYDKPITLEAGAKLTLRYRVLVHAGMGEKDKLQAEFDAYAAGK